MWVFLLSVQGIDGQKEKKRKKKVIRRLWIFMVLSNNGNGQKEKQEKGRIGIHSTDRNADGWK